MVGGAEGAVSGRGWDGSGQGDVDAARRIAWSIKCQENPSRLDLSNRRVECLDDLSQLCQTLALPASLTQHVDLRHNGLGPEAADPIARMLVVNRSLLSLDLRWNRIGTAGATTLLSSLTENRILQDCRLAGNDVDSVILSRIDDCCRRNRLHRPGPYGSLADCSKPCRPVVPVAFGDDQLNSLRTLMSFDRKEKERAELEATRAQNRLSVALNDIRQQACRERDLANAWDRERQRLEHVLADARRSIDNERVEHDRKIRHLEERCLVSQISSEEMQKHLQEKLEHWQRCYAEMEGDHAAAVESQERMASTRIQAVCRQRDAAQHEVLSLRAELDVSRHEIAELRRAAQQMQAEIVSLSRQLADSSTQVSQAKAGEADAKSALAIAQNRLAIAEKQALDSAARERDNALSMAHDRIHRLEMALDAMSSDERRAQAREHRQLQQLQHQEKASMRCALSRAVVTVEKAFADDQCDPGYVAADYL
ncbi:unnamed protein product (mitochondrion) [Plasmodiophora brassicae]|uniref:Uncharacterized protein n=1 Tax=Plasmodiophora brassicae TaxID=37360 RepID=A0A3P3YKS4_PLABS|nr:unnamed protein product [Plasmodiophora brassicae]